MIKKTLPSESGLFSSKVLLRLPAKLAVKGSGLLLAGVSMIPRAEVSMIIIQKGRSFEGFGITDQIFGRMIFVGLVTCLIVPIVLEKSRADRFRCSYRLFFCKICCYCGRFDAPANE